MGIFLKQLNLHDPFLTCGDIIDCIAIISIWNLTPLLLWRKIRYSDKKSLIFRDPIFFPFIPANPIIV